MVCGFLLVLKEQEFLQFQSVTGKILGIQRSMYLEVSGSRKYHECLYYILTLMDLLSKIWAWGFHVMSGQMEMPNE